MTILILSTSAAVFAQTATVQGSVKLVDSKGTTVADASGVVVFIDGDLAPSTTIKPAIKMSHLNQQFSPRVLPIKRGEAVDFLNDDGIYHNVFSLSRIKPFDLGVYPQGTSKVVTFDDTGLVKIYCNLHPKMISNILVLNNDFYTVTDESGHFEITDLPMGSYSLRFWHELTEEQSIDITLRTNMMVIDDINLAITRKIIQHKNKFGKRYKTKY